MVRIDVRRAIKERILPGREETKDAALPCNAAAEAAELNSNTQAEWVLQQKVERQPRLSISTYQQAADVVQGVTYVPGLLSTEEEAAIVQAIDDVPQARWIQGEGRRMLNFGGFPGRARVSEPLPPFAKLLVQCLVAAGLFTRDDAPNHLLVNDYRGPAGIVPHQDGPLYPHVATITLLGPALLSLHRALDEHTPGPLLTQVLLQPRGLLMLSGEAYSGCLHSIETRAADVITASCCNAAQEGLEVGSVVPRSPRRLSLVFVHKRACA